MKLSDGYIPDNCVVKDNPLYEHFQTEFLNALSGPPDREPRKEHITSEEYHYELDPHEIDFYEKIFVPSSLYHLSDNDSFLKEIFRFLSEDEVSNITIDNNVKDILGFLELEDKVLVLIAPIGWGKTVLLQYVWFYLMYKSVWLQKNVFPIYIAVDRTISTFKDNRSTSEIRKNFYQNLIKERLIEHTKYHTQLDNEQFWTYLKTNTDSYNWLEQLETDVPNLYKPNSVRNKTKIEFAIKQARMKAKEQDDFYLYATKYVIENKGKKVVLVFDNLDPMSLIINQTILDEAIELSRNFGFKVIVSMRKITYNALAANPSGMIRAYPPRRLLMETRNVRQYMHHRMDVINKELFPEPQRKVPSYIYLYEGEKRISFEDARKVVFSLTNVLLGDESSRFLENISYWNLRKLNRYLINYLSSGYIDVDKLITLIVKEQTTGEKNLENPLWILLTSTITGNYATHFPDRLTQDYEIHVLNVYCNGDNLFNRYLIRLHLLNYLNNSNILNFSSQQIIASYSEVTGIDKDKLDHEVNYAIIRFMKHDLVESANYYDIDHQEMNMNLENLNITPTGRYYLSTFRNYYEYLVYMKDDVDLRDNPYAIQNCIKVKSLGERYLELHKFLSFLVDEEQNFLLHLKPEHYKTYLNNFSCHNEVSSSVFYDTVRSVINFGNDRGLSRTSIKKFEDLLSRIISYSGKRSK